MAGTIVSVFVDPDDAFVQDTDNASIGVRTQASRATGVTDDWRISFGASRRTEQLAALDVFTSALMKLRAKLVERGLRETFPEIPDVIPEGEARALDGDR